MPDYQALRLYLVWDAEGEDDREDTVVEELFSRLDNDSDTEAGKKKKKTKKRSRKDSESSNTSDDDDDESSSESSSETCFWLGDGG